MSSLVGMEHVQLGRCSGAASASSTSMNSTKPKPRCLGDDTSNAASRSLWESRAPRAPGFPVFMSRGISTSEAENETSPMPRGLPASHSTQRGRHSLQIPELHKSLFQNLAVDLPEQIRREYSRSRRAATRRLGLERIAGTVCPRARK